MSTYQPESRRPIADVFRRTAHGTVRLCLRLGIHPNTVSYASIVAAAGAGICFWQAYRVPALVIPAVGFCYLRLWFNMLDGPTIAIVSGLDELIPENDSGKPWIMRRRTQAEMDELVQVAGFEKISEEIDPWGIFTVSVARKATG
jgi:hypothetical protein